MHAQALEVGDDFLDMAVMQAEALNMHLLFLALKPFLDAVILARCSSWPPG